MTEIESTCSGFTDISGLSDLNPEDFPIVEGTIDAGAEESETEEKVVSIFFLKI